MASTSVLTSFRRCGFSRNVAIPSGPSVDSMRNVVMPARYRTGSERSSTVTTRRRSGSHPSQHALGRGHQPHALVLGHTRHDQLVAFQVVGVTVEVVDLDAVTLE